MDSPESCQDRTSPQDSAPEQLARDRVLQLDGGVDRVGHCAEEE